ncbi:MAG: FMN-binding negative transcriptional regulator [Proteobacteria bacterium]|nr:FMN-binding negative transcriptional regulator [Pseudomonadota bacterium]
MYIRKAHQLTDQEAIHGLVAAYPLGAWVCQGAGGQLIANHIPFVLDRSLGPQGTLVGHVSRANGVWRELAAGRPSVVMFQGPQAYITPGWYPGKAAHGKVVPTWNYAVVHAHGVARAVEDADWLLVMLNRLTQAQEAAQATPWQVADAPKPYIDALLRGIVGIAIPVDSLEAKLKASQDEAPEDRLGTVAGLAQMPGDTARCMGEWVKRAADADAL